VHRTMSESAGEGTRESVIGVPFWWVISG
jgi:hypothetical protein